MAEALRAPQRIALVIPSLRGGGLERLARDLALKLDRHTFLPEVFCLDGLGVFARDLQVAGIRVHDCRESRLRIRGLPLRLIRALARFHPHLIHAHSGTWYPAAIAKTLLRYPRLVFTDHGRYPPEPRSRALIERWCNSRTDRLVAVSATLARYVKDFLHLPALPAIAENGIDLAAYQPDPSARAAFRAALGLHDNDVLAIAVGRLVAVKDHAGLIDAFAVTAHDTPQLHLALAGTGPLEGMLREHIRRCQLEDRVHLLGFRSDVSTCLGAADVFVISSTTEGLPVALLEALAAGLPTVATRVGGVPAALGDPPAGLLVPAGEPKTMGAALQRLASDRHLRARLSARARAQATRYSVDAFAGRYSELYQSVLSGGDV